MGILQARYNVLNALVTAMLLHREIQVKLETME